MGITWVRRTLVMDEVGKPRSLAMTLVLPSIFTSNDSAKKPDGEITIVCSQ